MKIKKQLSAMLAAGAMGITLVGVALAVPTPASDRGVTPTTVLDANITAEGNGNTDAADCDLDDAVETGDAPEDEDFDGDATSTNGVTVAWTYTASTKEFSFTATGGLVTIAYVKGGGGYNIYDYSGFAGGGAAWDSGMFSPDTNNDGNPQGLSHAVFCTGSGEEPSEAPSFEQSQEGETDPPSEAPSTAPSDPPSTAPSDPPSTAPSDPPSTAPSFEQSQAAESEAPSEAPSLEQTQAGDTHAPTNPNTSTIGTGGPASPADGAWLLVVGLGMLLGGVVVLTPARAKSRR